MCPLWLILKIPLPEHSWVASPSKTYPKNLHLVANIWWPIWMFGGLGKCLVANNNVWCQFFLPPDTLLPISSKNRLKKLTLVADYNVWWPIWMFGGLDECFVPSIPAPRHPLARRYGPMTRTRRGFQDQKWATETRNSMPQNEGFVAFSRSHSPISPSAIQKSAIR